MRNLIFATPILAIAMTAMSFTNLEPANSKEVNTSTSQIIWKARKVTGSHEGTVKLKSGNLEFNNGVLTGGRFEIDMTSIAVTDLSGDM